ncbi:MAG: cyclic pyranopterin monophosphate synthase MoaC [Chthoniobacterales bacterium]|jgi:cyclic pyranopterin phosphate synthase
MKELSHVGRDGAARMVDVGSKPVVDRVASAKATLVCSTETIHLLKTHALPKGDILAVARVAGIQAAKQTALLIPLCHPLSLDSVAVDFQVGSGRIDVVCVVKIQGRTGVEMEALTGASIAALCLYDMAKAVDKTMRIDGIRVLQKEKSGE